MTALMLLTNDAALQLAHQYGFHSANFQLHEDARPAETFARTYTSTINLLNLNEYMLSKNQHLQHRLWHWSRTFAVMDVCARGAIHIALLLLNVKCACGHSLSLFALVNSMWWHLPNMLLFDVNLALRSIVDNKVSGMSVGIFHH
jgi:hypothetical protein